MTLVHLVRHARTLGNLELRAVGWGDDPICQEWRPAIDATAETLVDLAVTRIVSSPVARALQSAAPLVERTGLRPLIDERVGELRVGPWTGLTEPEIAESWPEDWAVWRAEPDRLDLVGRETLQVLNDRVAEALEYLTRAEDGDCVAVYTHDAVIRAAVAWALGVGPAIYGHVQVDNCSITTLSVAAGSARLVRLNDRCHLEGLALD